MNKLLKKYHGSWTANNGSTYSATLGYHYANLKIARKEMRAMAMGNTFAGNTGHWEITDDNEYSRVVASGVVRN